ncbi:MAG: M10 family metallopeptidase [Microvirga sp.]
MSYASAAQGSVASWGSLDHAASPNGMTSEGPSAAGGVAVGATGIRNIDALLSGYRWTGPITYSFPDVRSDYEARYAEATAPGFGPITPEQQQVARTILEGANGATGSVPSLTAFEGFTAASISDAGSNGADIRIARSSSADPTAYAYYPGTHYTSGDVWFGTAYDYGNPLPGSYSYMATIHELGHALGLKHGHVGGGVSDEALTAADDTVEMSIMTYRSYAGQSIAGYTNETYGYAQSFMIDDIAALQSLYGANFSTRSGPTTYSWDPSTGQAFVDGVAQEKPGANRVFLTVWDGGGTDGYDFSNYDTNLSVDLTPGGWSTISPAQIARLGPGQYARGNVFNALQHEGDPRSLIENARGGSGDDAITGNVADNALVGGAGQDSLSGAAGNDSLYGGSGDDRLDGGAGTDTAFFVGPRDEYVISHADAFTFTVTDGRSGRDGSDRLVDVDIIQFADQTFMAGATSAALAAGVPAAPVQVLSGGGSRDRLVGSADGDRIQGFGGNDVLDGKAGDDQLVGGRGKDLLIGGLGRDTFVFDVRPTAANVDRIKDFKAAVDVMQLENGAMPAVGKAGLLKRDAFYKGSAAHDASDRVIYDPMSGALSYDPDGSGPAGARLLAHLQSHPKITHKDVWVI